MSKLSDIERWFHLIDDADSQLTYGMGSYILFNEFDNVFENPIVHDLALTVGSTISAVAMGEENYSALTAMKGWSQLRRAKWAGSTAAALAMADGPLPIGDALAVAVLASFAVYETYQGISNLVQ